MRRMRTGDSATPHPDPSGGQAPALHFPSPPLGVPSPNQVLGHVFAGVSVSGVKKSDEAGNPPLAGLKPATTATWALCSRPAGFSFPSQLSLTNGRGWADTPSVRTLC